MNPKPPCGRNCPKRSAIPNCHDSVVCPDWAAYQEALAEWSEAMKAEKREKADLKATIDYDDVENTIKEAAEIYDLKQVGFDPYLSRTITQRLTPHVNVIEIPQDLKNMSPAMKETDTLMANHQLLHVHNTCFRWTFGNVRCYEDCNGNIRPQKHRSIGRIDPTVASIIVVAVWMIVRNQPEDLADVIESGKFSM